MTNKTKLFEHISDEYSLMLLNWAYKKLGDRVKAEDLAQEVLLQIYSSIRHDHFENGGIEKLENYVWKIAHYVWCYYLRKSKSYKNLVPIDDLPLFHESDFVSEYADNEEEKQLIACIRRQISRLNYLQREIMVSFYIDGKNIRQISEQLSISESSIKWHLFDTRKKLKKEIIIMNNNDYVYRPRRLDMAISGEIVPMLDIKMIENSLTKQNICIACYAEPQTLDELSERLGLPKAYIEDDLKWLIEKEFVAETSGKYSTIFMIDNAYNENEKYRIYLNHKETFSDVIVNDLIGAEGKIRKIGFVGCEQPMDKMLWFLIYCYNNYKRIPVSPTEIPDTPVRPDGGRYFPLGFDRTDWASIKPAIYMTGWAYNGSMCANGFNWFGLYNFGHSQIESVIFRYTDETQKLNSLLRTCMKETVKPERLDEDSKYLLSKLVKDGFVRIEDNCVKTNFYVFTAEQYRELEETVFKPIADKLSDELLTITDEFRKYCRDITPPHLKHYSGLFVKMALWDIAYITTILAFNDGKLYVPKDNHDGEFLTFLFVE